MGYKYKTVMVIDDSETDLYIAEVMIEAAGFAEKVICLDSGKKALAHLRSLSNPEELPDLIFLDINMPGMTGFEFLNEYKHLPESIRKKCVIMMLTTSLNEDDRLQAEGNEFVHKFLNKPLDKEKLAECIDN